MGIKTSEELKSTGYRCLFECVQKEGIEPILNLVTAARSIPRKDILIKKAIMTGENDLTTLLENNKDIIQYLKEYKK